RSGGTAVMPESPILAELRTLLDALCEESITPEQLARLEELVLAHPEAEAFYVQFMSFHADLVRAIGLSGRVEETVRALDPAANTAPNKPPARPPNPAPAPQWRLWRGRSVLALAALVASVLLALGIWIRTRPESKHGPTAVPEATDETVAVLLQTYNAQWEDA